MRKLTVLLAAIASFAFFGMSVAGMRLEPRAAVWRTSALNAAGYVDSSTASINGALQTVDTAYVDLSDIVWENFSIQTGVYGAARLWLTSTLNTSTDTLFFALEPIAPDGQPVSSTAFNKSYVTTAGDEALTALISSDSDYIVPNISFCKAVRVRVRADGNTGARFPNARLWITFYSDKP
jgi:hypothetical protein